jgi:hypothetical protein
MLNPRLASRLGGLCALALVVVLPSQASTNPCVVTPNPLSLATDTQFTVTASGAIPLESYEVTDQQTGHHKTDEDRVWLGQADSNGQIVAVVPAGDGRTGSGSPYALWPGDVKVTVIHYHQGGKISSKGASVLATCAFTVVE